MSLAKNGSLCYRAAVPNDKETLPLDPDLEALEDALETDDSAVEVSEEEAARLALSPDLRIARAASKAIARVEREKDNPQALSEQLTQKYLDVGRSMLGDGSATRLGGRVRDRVSNILGYDPGDVKIHTGERAAEAADAMDARAFAVGDNDVYFGRGQFNPETPEGLGVLVHELTHVADNQVGAAFDSRSGGVQYSRAEEHAEAAEDAAQRFSVRQDATDYEAQGEAQHTGNEEAGEDAIDMKRLEDAVAKLLERNNRRSMDRTGQSGHGP